jgi:dTDP-4-amino-4,6-dideoxygalactose transaminase
MTFTTSTHLLDAAGLDEIPAETVQRWHAAIADELRAAFEAVLPEPRFTLGPRLRAFETELAAYVGTTHGIGVSSGTAGLTLALRALGVGPGDEVVTVCNTYVATAFAITYCGATPVFVDVDPVTLNMNPAEIPAALSRRTKAIVPVHMYGQAVDVDAIRVAAPGIPILEDAAHAHGATYGERKCGSLGDVAAFSFYPTKVMGALGDGGAITTSNDELERRLRQLRYMGQAGTKHDHQALGYQERLDELQAAFLSVKLRHLEEQLAGRRRVADRYRDLLAGTPVVTPEPDVTGRHSYYMFTCQAPRRDKLAAYLAERGISTQVIYPKLVPDQGAYRDHPWRGVGDFPIARAATPKLLCLPMFAELSDAEVERVGLTVRAFYGLD